MNIFTSPRRAVLLVLIAIGGIAGIATFFTPRYTQANIVEQIRKTTDQTVSGTTPQNDTELALPLKRNRTYIIDGSLFVRSSASGAGCRIEFEVPTGATVKLGVDASVAGGDGFVATENGNVPEGAGAACPPDSPEPVFISGTIQMGSTDGDLQLKTASGLAGESTTVEAGSFLRADKL